MRHFLLANSATVIQDDSGVPLAYYSPKRWRLFPFGRYKEPIDEFPGRYQEEYAELFRRSQPIDFGIGYRWRTYESNLLLSVRLPSDGSAAEEAIDEPTRRPRRPRAATASSAAIGPAQGRRRFLLVWTLAGASHFTSGRSGWAR